MNIVVGKRCYKRMRHFKESMDDSYKIFIDGNVDGSEGKTFNLLSVNGEFWLPAQMPVQKMSTWR